MTTYYLDLWNGGDGNSGLSFANAKKTFAAAAALAVEGDTIRMAKTGSLTALPGTWSTGTSTGVKPKMTGNSSLGIKTIFAGFGGSAVNVPTVTSFNTYTHTIGASALWQPPIDTSTVNGGIGTTYHGVSVGTAGTPATNTKTAVFALPAAQDLSAYDTLCIWMSNNTQNVQANNSFRVALCSDTAGNTIVEDWPLDFPVNCLNGYWFRLPTVNADLGATINSVAIYTGASVPPVGTKLFWGAYAVDSTTAPCMPGDYIYSPTHKMWWPLQIVLNGDTATPEMYRGVNGDITNVQGETLSVIKRRPHLTLADFGALGQADVIAGFDCNSATLFNNVTVRGGYNTATNVVDGLTFWDAGPENKGTYSRGLFMSVLPGKDFNWENLFIVGGHGCFPNSPDQTASTRTFNYTNCGCIASRWTRTASNIRFGNCTWTNCFSDWYDSLGYIYQSTVEASGTLTFTDCTFAMHYWVKARWYLVYNNCRFFTSNGSGTAFGHDQGGAYVTMNDCRIYATGIWYWNTTGLTSYDGTTKLGGVRGSGNIQYGSYMNVTMNIGSVFEGWTLQQLDGSGNGNVIFNGAGTFFQSGGYKVKNCHFLTPMSTAANLNNILFEGCTIYWVDTQIVDRLQNEETIYKDCTLGRDVDTGIVYFDVRGTVRLYNCTLRRVQFRRRTSTAARVIMIGGQHLGTGHVPLYLTDNATYYGPWGIRMHNVTFQEDLTAQMASAPTTGTYFRPYFDDTGDGWLTVSAYNKVPTDTRMWSPTMTAATSNTVVRTPGGKSWLVSTGTFHTAYEDIDQWVIARVAVRSGYSLTAKCYVYANNEMYAMLKANGGQVGTMTAKRVSSTYLLTQWEELSLTFTPDADGVIEFYLTFSGAANRSMYIDDFSFIQT